MGSNSYYGYHGTNKKSSRNILDSSFKPSKGDSEWIGDGVYFFISGLNKSPEIQAQKYAIAKSWDNDKKKYVNSEVHVIKSEIKHTLYTIDLRDQAGVEVIDYLQIRFIEKIKQRRKNIYENIDGLLINLARSNDIFNIDVVIGNFYIKFADERINQLNRRTPNSTICSVYKLSLIANSKFNHKKDIDDNLN